MSFPNIPNITPTISVGRSEVVNLLLASIALEELGLAHVINAEGEKIQAVVGTLPSISIANVTLSDLLAVNQSVNETMRSATKTEMLLEFKLEEILQLLSTTTTTTSTTTTTTTTTTCPPLFLFGNIASATGSVEGCATVVEAEDVAFFNSNFQPAIVGYSITQTPIIGVPTIPQPSIHVVKEVSVDGGASFQDANVPPGPTLPAGFKPRFRVTVSNNGNVPLFSVTVTDPSLNLVSVIPTLASGSGVQFLAIPL